MIGQQIGQYRIVRKLAQGGMGVVYEARHEWLPLSKAVKVLARAPDDREAERFYQEASAASRVRHRSLVELFDFGRISDGTLFMMMELLDGETLRDRLHRMGGRLPLAQALPLIRQIAGALLVVHRAQIVHCDLTPANIMLVPEPDDAQTERAKILDFGIARFLAESDTGGESGQVIGTPRYMSPEQCQGLPVDTHSDVYALGILVFELLTGEWPYADVAHQRDAIWRAHQTARPRPLSELLPSAPEALVVLCGDLLTKQPASRPHMTEVLARLDALEGRSESMPERASVQTSPSVSAPLATETATATAASGSVSGSASFALVRRPPRWVKAGMGLLLFVAMWAAGLRRFVPMRTAPPLFKITGMVSFPPTQFFMGSSREDIAYVSTLAHALQPDLPADLFEREQPQRRVQLSAFYLDAKEVTNADYAQFLNTSGPFVLEKDEQGVMTLSYGGRRFVEVDRGRNPDQPGLIFHDQVAAARPGFALRPVVYVTWYGADAYCRHQGKHLPTEAQWELAARGGGSHTYPWGESQPQCGPIAFGHKTGQPCSPKLLDPLEVATSPGDHSAQGVFDLAGNVEEWVLDRFLHGYEPCGDCNDPLSTGSLDFRSGNPRVQRGGNFRGSSLLLRAAGRSRMGPEQTDGNVGFRCAMTQAGFPSDKRND